MKDDYRQHAPATRRNREPILSILEKILPQPGLVLEIASGSGEHAAWFAQNLPGILWQPSDIDPSCNYSIKMWANDISQPSVLPPLTIDASSPDWPVQKLLDDLNAIVCINMIHIAPWDACRGLMQGAGKFLPSGGILYLYGPFHQPHVTTAKSNIKFDQSLQQQDTRWGVRHLDKVKETANENDLNHTDTIEMPANNLSVVFTRR
tara:strand:- start:1548 stop:2165 length:618 start_codon:yes stop_codon:yes gene_type:complete